MRTLPLLVASLLAYGGCTVLPGPVPPPADRAPDGTRPPGGAPPEVACPGPAAVALVDEANGRRSRAGLAPLATDVRLTAAALRHARDLASGAAPGHTGSDGSTADRRVDEAGYRWRRVAENVAAGQPTPREVVAGWMASPGHRRNLLADDVRHVGAAHAYRPDGRLHHFWVMVFGDDGGPAEAPGAACG